MAKQIDTLIQFEGRCAGFYLELARIFRHVPELRALWRAMASDERLHHDLLDRVKLALLAEKRTHQAIDIDEQALIRAIEECEERLHEGMSADEAFALAVRLESIEFREIVEQLASRPDLSMLAWAAKSAPSEQGHLRALMAAADKFVRDEEVRSQLKSLIRLRLRLGKKEEELESLKQQLQEIESYLVHVLDNTLDAIIWIDNDQVIRSWNKGAEQIFGYKADEIIGKSFELLVPEELRRARELEKIASNVKRHGSIRSYQTERIAKDGRRIIVDLTSTAIRDRNGRMIGRVAFIRDITKSRQLEREVHETRDFLESVLNSTSEVVTVTDLDGKIKYINPAAERAIGYKLQEIVNCDLSSYYEDGSVLKTIMDLLLVGADEEKLKGALGPRVSILECNSKQGMVRYETSVRRKDGSKAVLQVSKSILRDKEGRPIGFISVSRDVSKIKELEREREMVREQLYRSERLAELGQLAAGVAHELRNPLAGIKGAIEVLKDSYVEDSTHRQVMGEMLQRVERLNAVVRDLLEYAKPTPPSKMRIRLTELVDGVVKVLRRDPKLSRVEIQRDYSSDVAAWADPNLMERVFINIILNAVQAMNFSGTLRISLRERDECVSISFNDTGPGMDEGVLKKIFDPFFTTKPEGSGLGLSLCKKYVDAHGGRIEVRSEPGKGTTFTVILPQASDQSPTIP